LKTVTFKDIIQKEDKDKNLNENYENIDSKQIQSKTILNNRLNKHILLCKQKSYLNTNNTNMIEFNTKNGKRK